jgi:Ca-activated chloride channel family protein
MKRFTCVLVLAFFCIACWAGGSKEAASSSSGRGSYLAGKGIIIPPEEVKVESYIAAINYQYPKPETRVGVSLYTGHKQVSSQGQGEVIQVGIQARELPYEELPPMNLAFVIDKSSSMSDNDKIGWVKKGFSLFLGKVRESDFVSLVVFDDQAKVVFPSTRMSSPEVRNRFKDAVDNLTTGGGSNMLAGLTLGYEQVMSNFRQNYTNRVIFLSDGTEFSARLRGAKAKGGNLRVSLLWDNRNDLDLHVITPSGEEIFYGNKKSADSGELDVDMNVHGESLKPVENIYWPADVAPEGDYKVYVQNFAYHEPLRNKTHYVVEVFNNGEIAQYEGDISGERAPSNSVVCMISHRTIKKTGALGIYGLAERYKELGINVSTIGVGLEFDIDLMDQLASAGGGSSRFISDEAEAVRTFDTDFDRMVVPAVRDCRMTLTLSPGVTLVGTWGYDNHAEGNTVTYSLSTLHHRDYETILAEVLVPPSQSLGRKSLGTFALTYRNLQGDLISMGPMGIDVDMVSDPAPVTGFSDGMVMKSGTMLHFARALQDIGRIYYSMPQGSIDPAKLAQAAELAVETKKELTNVDMRLGGTWFKTEVGMMDKYIQILGADIGSTGKEGTQIVQDEEIAPPVSDRGLTEKLAGLFREISLEMGTKDQGFIAVSGFATKKTVQPPLIALLNESALLELSKAANLKVVERERMDAVMKEQKLALSDLMDTANAIAVGKVLSARFILTGSVIEMPGSVVIFARIVNVETAEVESAAQVIVPKNAEIKPLL